MVAGSSESAMARPNNQIGRFPPHHHQDTRNTHLPHARVRGVELQKVLAQRHHQLRPIPHPAFLPVPDTALEHGEPLCVAVQGEHLGLGPLGLRLGLGVVVGRRSVGDRVEERGGVGRLVPCVCNVWMMRVKINGTRRSMDKTKPASQPADRLRKKSQPPPAPHLARRTRRSRRPPPTTPASSLSPSPSHPPPPSLSHAPAHPPAMPAPRGRRPCPAAPGRPTAPGDARGGRCPGAARGGRGRGGPPILCACV